MHQPILAVFDFDHTILDDNTDIVARKLLPNEKLPDSVKGLYRSDGWIAYMGKIFELLHENSIDAGQIETAIVNIPPVSGMKELLTEMHARDYEIIIISDSNSIFIENWLQYNGLYYLIRKIYTNPAKIDESGLMKVDRYHTQDKCKLSTVNLCKGDILENHIKIRNEEGKYFDKIIYVGDGRNDLCPIARLSENDIAFPRIDYALIKLLKNANNFDIPAIRAHVMPWSNGAEILKQLDEKI